MKRKISLLFALILMIMGVARGDYNPVNPPDPMAEGTIHRVFLTATPEYGGTVSATNFELTEGASRTVFATPNPGFRFSCWKQDGRILQTERALNIEMGNEDIRLTAQFVYDPDSPGDPGTNSWNQAMGLLIVDDFTPGQLLQRINDLTSRQLNAVREIIVIGAMENSDFNAVKSLPNIEVADFSRTSGASEVPSYAFSNCGMMMEVSLPSSVLAIGPYAFSGCDFMSLLKIYALVPPTVGTNAFLDLPSDMVVKVYSRVLLTYRQTNPYGNYFVEPLDLEGAVLQVTLPDNSSDGRYEGCTLNLQNLLTGERQRLLIDGSHSVYAFFELMPQHNYDLWVTSPSGYVLGRHDGFRMREDGVNYKFDSLLQIHAVDISIYDPAGEDVTDSCDVTWFDNDGKYLGAGRTLQGQLQGVKLGYELGFPESLISWCVMPGRVHGYEVIDGENHIEIRLESLPTFALHGHVTDELTGVPIAGAYVTVSQTVNRTHHYTSTTTTEADGSYALTLHEAAGLLNWGAEGCTEKSKDFADKTSIIEDGELTLNTMRGSVIEVTLMSRRNITRDEQENAFIPFEDTPNVDYRLWNETSGMELTDLWIHYPHIVLLDGVEEGDIIRVRATPLAGGFNAAEQTCTIHDRQAEMKFTFMGNGDVRATASDSDVDKAWLLLYNSAGTLVSRTPFEDLRAEAKSLTAGDYTAVAIMDSRAFSAVATLSHLLLTPLKKGSDYLMQNVKVEDGYITLLSFGTIPSFDETEFEYLSSSYLKVSTGTITGNALTIATRITFNEDMKDEVGDVRIFWTLPEGWDYVKNSMIVGGDGADRLDIDGRHISVVTSTRDASPRFSAIPRKAGTFLISAMVEFSYGGRTYIQPVGSAQVNITDHSISVPAETCRQKVTVTGNTFKMCKVTVYDNDINVGTILSTDNGNWKLAFDLYGVPDTRNHEIWAKIETQDGFTYRTLAHTCRYNPDTAELAGIEMITGASHIYFNYQDATTTPRRFTYWGDKFTLKAIFPSGMGELVRDLDFVILCADGNRKREKAVWMEELGAWVATYNCGWSRNQNPLNVRVLYTLKTDDPGVRAHNLPDPDSTPWRCPDVETIFDPSGFVYEAVTANRLPGVQATIYYRDLTENLFGDVDWKETIWDAEAYAQKNPLFTDSEGQYHWDVPEGEWQVRFSKEGYEPARTEWLPVPPPQLDVNVGMTQSVRPSVSKVMVYPQAVEVTFSKYMDPSSIGSEEIIVTSGGKPCSGRVVAIGAGQNEEGTEYARTFRFDATESFDSEEVGVTVSGRAASYAGIRMAETYSQQYDIEPEITGIEVSSEHSAYVGQELRVEVKVTGTDSLEGRILTISSDHDAVTSPTRVAIGADGSATLEVVGRIPGATPLTLAVEGSNLEPVTSVLHIDVETTAAPEASLPDGSVITKDETVELSCATPGAEIWYTTDGSSPEKSSTRRLYTDPIQVDRNLTLAAYATATGMKSSNEITWIYEKDVLTGVAEVSGGSISLEIDDEGRILLVRLAKDKECQVRIYDTEGRMLLMRSVTGNSYLVLPGQSGQVLTITATCNNDKVTLKHMSN